MSLFLRRSCQPGAQFFVIFYQTCAVSYIIFTDTVCRDWISLWFERPSPTAAQWFIHFLLHVTKLQHIYIIHMARCETAFCVFINCVLWCYSCKQLLGKTLFSPSSSSCKVNWLLLQQQPHSQFNGFARLLLQTAGVRGSQMVAMVGDTADAESIIALKYSSVFTFVKVFIYSLIKYYLLDA